MKTKSIKTKLTVLVMLSIACSFIFLGLKNTQNAYELEHELIKEQELNLAKNISAYLGSYFKLKLLVMEATAKGLIVEPQNLSNENITEKLKIGLEASDSALLFYGFEKDGYSMLSTGNYLTPQRDNYDSRKRGWYKEAIAKDGSGVTLPYLSKSLQKLVVSLYTPVKSNGTTIGVLGSDILLDSVINIVTSAKIGKTGYAYIVNEDGQILIHSDKKLLMKKSKYFTDIKTKEKVKFAEVKYDNEEYLVSYSKIPNTTWYICVKVDKGEVFEDINKNIKNEILLYAILLILVLLVVYFSLKKVLSPLQNVEKGLANFFRYLKGEEKNIDKLNIKTNDEFGLMGKLIDEQMHLVSQQIEKDKLLIDEVKNVVNRLKEGHLDICVEKDSSSKSLEELKQSINEMIEFISTDVNKDINTILSTLEKYSNLDFTTHVENANGKIALGLNNLCEIITKMLKENKLNGYQLNESSKNLLENVDILNRASNETAVSLEETASALEEITSTVVSNTSKIKTMQEYSEELTSSINQGKELAHSTVESMEKINEEALSISEAITVIDQIAFQTNILSLNAAVEAATAGEAGKGFAVVAQEVRNLASRSAEAAKEIKDLVEKAKLRTIEGKEISANMINGYIKINENIDKTNEIIKDISDSSSEQKFSIEQINGVVNTLDSQTQNNASVANQTQEIAKQTTSIAKKILDSASEKKFIE
jgi:methyl-accepting chemotaxis protein